MNDGQIYFADERWKNLEAELAQIKKLLGLVLQKLSQPTTEEEVLLTSRQVAQWLAIDVATVYARCANNMLPHFKVGKQYKFRRAEIQEWMENSKEHQEINVDELVDRYLQSKVLKG